MYMCTSFLEKLGTEILREIVSACNLKVNSEIPERQTETVGKTVVIICGNKARSWQQRSLHILREFTAEIFACGTDNLFYFRCCARLSIGYCLRMTLFCYTSCWQLTTHSATVWPRHMSHLVVLVTLRYCTQPLRYHHCLEISVYVTSCSNWRNTDSLEKLTSPLYQIIQ